MITIIIHKEENIKTTTITTKKAPDWPSSPPTITTKKAPWNPPSPKRIIYHCGWNQTRNIIEPNIFHDFSSWSHEFGISDTSNIIFPPSDHDTEYDLLIYGMHGTCPNNVLNWTRHVFRGKILYVNGEGMENDPIFQEGDVVVNDARSNRSYVLGYHEDSSRSVLLPFGLIVLMDGLIHNGRDDDQMKALIDPQQRPRNTMDKFLLYINSNCVCHREQAFDQIAQSLNTIVDYAGKCRGVCGSHNSCLPKCHHEGYQPNNKRSARVGHSGLWGENSRLVSSYRFCLVGENTLSVDGYMTEKIINAFLGGCVPIYIGPSLSRNVMVRRLFNPDAYVYYNVEDTQEALDRVWYLESNRTAYDEMLKVPIWKEGAVELYLSYRDDLGGGLLKRKIRTMLGLD